jgi:glycerol-3-phosphate dehydrogenase
VRGATLAGAVAANGVECLGALTEQGERVGIRARDLRSGEELAVRARVLVNAAGPWAGALAERILGRPEPRAPSLSLAWNLVLPGMDHGTAFALQGGSPSPMVKRGRRPRRLVFLPWRGRTLVGTGHAPFPEGAAALDMVDQEHPAVRGFLDEVNAAWPGKAISPHDILFAHVGLLPAHGPKRSSRTRAEVRLRRRHALAVERTGGAPLLTAHTVKFTMARRVAEEVMDRVGAILGREGDRSRTAETPLPGAPAEGMTRLMHQAEAELEERLPRDVIHHLVRSHGSAYREVAAWRNRDPWWDRRVVDGAPVIRAQLLHGAAREMALDPDDLLFRRCELGATGAVTPGAREQAEEILGHRGAIRERKPS